MIYARKLEIRVLTAYQMQHSARGLKGSIGTELINRYTSSRDDGANHSLSSPRVLIQTVVLATIMPAIFWLVNHYSLSLA